MGRSVAINGERWRLIRRALSRFKAERIRQGIKTQEMADRLGISRMGLWNLESGLYFRKRECPDPRFSVMYRYAKLLGISLDALDQDAHGEPKLLRAEPMTSEEAKELGRKGGQATLAKHGHAHFSAMAAKGGSMRRGRKYPRV